MKTEKLGSPNDATRQATAETLERLPADRMVKYPFPLRYKICCFLEVPRDLTRDEARKIHLYLTSLATK